MSLSTQDRNLFRSFITLFSGLAGVQVINFLFSLYLPTLFSPTDFALFGIYTGVVFILIELVNAKLDLAVMLPDNDNKAQELVHASFSAATLFTGLVSLVALPVAYWNGSIWISLPVVVWLYGVHQPILVYLNRNASYSAINQFRLLQVLATIVFTLLFVWSGWPHPLIAGFILGLAVATLSLLRNIVPRWNAQLLRNAWQSYAHFPKYGTWSALFNTWSRNQAPLLLAPFFSAHIVGLFSYATRLLNAPTGMYTAALGQLYFKEAARLKGADLKEFTRKIIRLSFLTGIVPSLLILVFGQELFAWLFSKEWAEAGKISQYLILWYLLGLMAAPVSTLLDILQQLQWEFRFNLVLLVTRTAAILVGGWMQDFYLALFLFALSGIILNGYLLYYIDCKLMKHDPA